ncbi:MAG: hypothetical protein ACI4L9_03630 [Candidatus Coproplasma sp.]
MKESSPFSASRTTFTTKNKNEPHEREFVFLFFISLRTEERSSEQALLYAVCKNANRNLAPPFLLFPQKHFLREPCFIKARRAHFLLQKRTPEREFVFLFLSL